MKRYIGTKRIHAEPMNRRDYNLLRGWELPADENGDDEGYLVEYVDGGQANHPKYKGYISWSPANVFEKAYRSVSGLSFGLALEALKAGDKIARIGWNGKGMYLVYMPGYENILANEATRIAHNLPLGATVSVQPYIVMKTAQNKLVPWLHLNLTCLMMIGIFWRKQMAQKVILTGLSACGKDTIANELTKHGYNLIRPYTTRPIREGETQGKPYFFINRGVYHQMLIDSKFIESNAYCTMFNGVEDWHYYGTSRASIEKVETDSILTIGVQSALRTMVQVPDAVLIYLDVPDEIRTERAQARGSFDPIEWTNRMNQDLIRRANNTYNLADMQYVVNNTRPLDVVIQDILSILNMEKKA